MISAIARSVSETIHSIEQRRGLSSPSATELTFEITDDEYLFQRLAADVACQIEFVGAVMESGGRCRVFVTVASLDDESVDLERVRDIASTTSTVESAEVVSKTSDGGRLELLLATPLLGVHFSEHVVEVTNFRATPNSVGVTLLLARPEAARDVASTIRDRYPNARLLSKRPRTAVDSDHERLAAFRDTLTPRQREVVQTAYLSGYFDTPRRCTGEELGEKLGISSQAVYQHIRSAQRKLFERAFRQFLVDSTAEQ
jgi:DNA-binding CsgD family transcriptional regulator